MLTTLAVAGDCALSFGMVAMCQRLNAIIWRTAQHTNNKHSVLFLLYLQSWPYTVFDVLLMYRLSTAHILPTGLACDNCQDALAYACKMVKLSSRDAGAF